MCVPASVRDRGSSHRWGRQCTIILQFPSCLIMYLSVNGPWCLVLEAWIWSIPFRPLVSSWVHKLTSVTLSPLLQNARCHITCSRRCSSVLSQPRPCSVSSCCCSSISTYRYAQAAGPICVHPGQLQVGTRAYWLITSQNTCILTNHRDAVHLAGTGASLVLSERALAPCK